ncbi:WAT1-related protein At3g30340-like [Syzygium oleosum]|uniref:WAT1-related protein At3g30340-like n=1 Tax=Syzygium oleosum TaxID=219896 RepID=UPI0011D18BD0|nr:WAT1-related protein At3g30340-like [Syzygium oleosum]
MAEENRSDTWQPYVAMLAIELAFAVVNVLFKKALDEGANPLVLITYRLSISTIFLAPISYILERNSRPKLTFRILCYFFFSAMLGASLSQYLFLFGVQRTSATFSCAFLNLAPVMTFVVALPFRMEVVDIRSSSGIAKVLGSIVCIVGVLTLSLYRGSSLLNHPQLTSHPFSPAARLGATRSTARWVMSSMALFLGTLLWSCWFLVQSNIGKLYPCKYTSTAFMSFFGALQSAMLAGLTPGRSLSVWVLKGKVEILTVVFAGMVCSGLCYVGMSWCVKKRGPVFTAAFSPLVQIFAAMIGIPALQEQLYLGSLLGSVLVIVGLYVLLWGKNREMHESIEKKAQPVQDIEDQEATVEAAKK